MPQNASLFYDESFRTSHGAARYTSLLLVVSGHAKTIPWEDSMARRAMSHTIALKYPVRVAVREPDFELLASVRHLKVNALAKSKRAEFALGHVKAGCCRWLVIATVKNGMVTGLRIEPLPQENLLSISPEFE